MEVENSKCAWQFFMGNTMPPDKLREMITLAYIHGETFGPVIMICTEQGYDFIVRNELDDLYIDFGICDTEDSVWGLVSHLKETQQLNDQDVINNLENCSEKIVSLYNVYIVPQSLNLLIQKTIDREAAINSI